MASLTGLLVNKLSTSWGTYSSSRSDLSFLIIFANKRVSLITYSSVLMVLNNQKISLQNYKQMYSVNQL